MITGCVSGNSLLGIGKDEVKRLNWKAEKPSFNTWLNECRESDVLNCWGSYLEKDLVKWSQYWPAGMRGGWGQLPSSERVWEWKNSLTRRRKRVIIIVVYVFVSNVYWMSQHTKCIECVFKNEKIKTFQVLGGKLNIQQLRDIFMSLFVSAMGGNKA